jgi:predicted PurR-regulated permease PerM
MAMVETDAPGGTPDQHVAGPQRVWVHRATVAWALVGILVLVAAGTWMFLKIADALVPFVVGGLIAFLARPLLRLFMKLRFPRGLAVLATFVLVLVVIGGAIWLIVPLVGAQFTQFIRELPSYWQQIQQWLSQLTADLRILPDAAKQAIDQVLSQTGQSVRETVTAIGQFMLAAGGGALGFGFNVFLGFILAIWFLLDGPGIAKWCIWVLPPSWRDDAEQIGHAFNDSFGGYIRGTIINMTITFLGCGVGFMLIGLPYGWFIAAGIGILDVIPYIGPIAGGIVATFIGFIAGGWVLALLTLIIVLIVQQSVDSVISPIVMGKSVSLHPVAILLALGLGGALAGFFGILISIPVAAAIYTVYLYYAERHLGPRLSEASGDGPDDDTPRPAEENA